MHALGVGAVVMLVLGGAVGGARAHPVYAGGEDNGVRIMSHANTDFHSVDGAPAGGKVRTYQDFEAHGNFDAKAALTHKGKGVATVDDVAAAKSSAAEATGALEAVVEALAAKVAALQANVTAEKAKVAALEADNTAEKAKVAALEATAPPSCHVAGTRSITFSAASAGWACDCVPGWTGDDCVTDSRSSLKAFADLAELKTALISCLDEDSSCGACPRTEAVYGLFGDWDVSAVTDFTDLFKGLPYFNGNVSKWNTSSVTSMYRMFHHAYIFNQDIGGWDTGNVKRMNWMFSYAYVFNQDISGWNVGQVTEIDHMFLEARAFWQDVSAWNLDGSVSTQNMWLASYVDANSVACSQSSRPSCTAGIQ